jgi:hypothetical protein
MGGGGVKIIYCAQCGHAKKEHEEDMCWPFIYPNIEKCTFRHLCMCKKFMKDDGHYLDLSNEDFGNIVLNEINITDAQIESFMLDQIYAILMGWDDPL